MSEYLTRDKKKEDEVKRHPAARILSILCFARIYFLCKNYVKLVPAQLCLVEERDILHILYSMLLYLYGFIHDGSFGLLAIHLCRSLS